MKPLKVNDIVRIKAYPEDHRNAEARVTMVYPEGVCVSNYLNMPHQGTFANAFFTYAEVEKK